MAEQEDAVMAEHERLDPADRERDVSGQWGWSQTNGWRFTVDVDQGGRGRITGAARAQDGQTGTLEGQVRKNDIAFLLTMGSGTVGDYQGEFDSSGLLTGETINRATNPPDRAQFRSNRTFTRFK